MTRLLVVGGGAAGMSAASVAKRRDPALEVTVVEAGADISFSACGMPYWIAGIVEGDAERLVVVPAAEARKERGLDVRVRTRVTAIDPDARTARLEGAGADGALSFDTLVLATGARARNPFAEQNLAGVFTLRHLDDGRALRAFLEERRPRRATIVGGGFVGLEMAEAFAELGLETRLVHGGPTLLGEILDEELGARVGARVEAAGVELMTDALAEGLEGEGDVRGVVVGGRSLAADVVVLGLGVDPSGELAEGLALETTPKGALVVDDGMRTSRPGVFACGDGVAVTHRVTGRPASVPLALHANRMGRIAGENATGGDARFPGVLGTTATRFCEMEIGATGLSEKAALEAGLEPVAVTIESADRAGYFPGVAALHARLVVDRSSGRVLGAQILGGLGAAKRVDAMAAAIWFGATAEEVEALDFAYAPPVNPVWDAWAIAARLAERRRGERIDAGSKPRG